MEDKHPQGNLATWGGGLQRGIIHRPSIEKGLDKLIVTQNILSIYPSVHNQLIRTLFEVHIVMYILFFLEGGRNYTEKVNYCPFNSDTLTKNARKSTVFS